MGFLNSLGNFLEKWEAAAEVVDSLNDLPPTYKTSNDGEYFDQILPDPVTEEGVERALDRVREAQEEWDRVNEK